jgi:hypothetical protein
MALFGLQRKMDGSLNKRHNDPVGERERPGLFIAQTRFLSGKSQLAASLKDTFGNKNQIAFLQWQ